MALARLVDSDGARSIGSAVEALDVVGGGDGDRAGSDGAVAVDEHQRGAAGVGQYGDGELVADRRDPDRVLAVERLGGQLGEVDLLRDLDTVLRLPNPCPDWEF